MNPAEEVRPRTRTARMVPKNECYCVVCGKGMNFPAYSTPKGITYCEEHRPDKDHEQDEEDPVRVRLRRRPFKP